MRITYRTLQKLIAKMNEDQLNSDLTVEVGDDDECFAAELRIAGDNHGSLDDGHPVIYFTTKSNPDDVRLFDVAKISKDIGL